MKKAVLSGLGQRIAEPPISWLMKMTLDHPKLISLAAGFTDNTSLPVKQARALLAEVLRPGAKGQAALQYGSTAGDGELRRLTAEHLQALDKSGAPAMYAPERMLMTHGSQQLLYMVTEALCDEGDIVLVEDPSYFVYLGIVQSHGLQARGIRMGPNGIEPGHLEKTLQELQRKGQLPRVKLLYLVSYFQNPTGITTSLENKLGALKLLRRFEKAAGHPIYLLEDAAYRELRFAGDDIPSALTGGQDAARVIYTGTYSKPFATGVRVGFGILPEPLLTVVRRIKGNHDFGTANLLQALLTQALASGAYKKHLEELRVRYAHKAKVMAQAARAHFPEAVQWDEPRGGLYLWARMPESVGCGVKSKFFRKALAADVLYVPGELCYADDARRRKPSHEMRLSFGGATEEEIRAGIERLGRVMRELL